VLVIIGILRFGAAEEYSLTDEGQMILENITLIQLNIDLF